MNKDYKGGPITNQVFFEMGRAKFVVHNDKGDKYTYKINKKEGKWTNPRTGITADTVTYFVSCLDGGNDSWMNYQYVGMYRPETGELKLTGKSTTDQKIIKIFQWAVDTVRNDKTIPEGYGVLHVGRCCKCAKQLTDPTSISIGIGPDCLKNNPQYEKQAMIREILR